MRERERGGREREREIEHTYYKEHKYEENANKASITQSPPPKTLGFRFIIYILIC